MTSDSGWIENDQAPLPFNKGQKKNFLKSKKPVFNYDEKKPQRGKFKNKRPQRNHNDFEDNRFLNKQSTNVDKPTPSDNESFDLVPAK